MWDKGGSRLAYRPPQRSISAWILTASRWIRGTFHLPRLHSFLDYLGREAAFFRLTDVELDGDGPQAPFFALRRNSAVIIAPECPEEDLKLEAPPGAMPHPVDCLLETGMVSGLLALLPNVRVSDYLMHQEGFVVLRAASFPPGGLSPPGPTSILFVNARALVGVRERNPSTPAVERAPAVQRAPAVERAAPAAEAAEARRGAAEVATAVEAPPERRREPERKPEPVPEPAVAEWVVTSRRG